MPKMTEQEERLYSMTEYPEYRVWLETIGLAFHFNAFVKKALDDEKHLVELEGAVYRVVNGKGCDLEHLRTFLNKKDQADGKHDPAGA